ncbi:MDR family MFS transporter [Paenibacillus hexagrammi]|uniref:MFS transporter n=1 Tax=Paenibacillus hexagrammi TaxID=2908839 RepID=A0ABY3SR80_9BACL|nr:MFS transporter [Paenibacillus sp. YPD9-1]UJF35910.1 MFS transporter [Paenibacillus sp. YPD9-1]
MRFRDFHRNVKLRIYMNFLSGTANNMVLPFMSIYFSGKLGDTSAGLAVILGIVAGVAAGICGGYYSDRIGRKKLMLLAEAGYTAAFAVMAVANSPWLESPAATLIMMIIVSMFWGLHGPAQDAMLLDVTPPEARKFMYAVKYWLNNLSFAVSGIAGAFLFKSYLFELFLGLTIIGVVTFAVTHFFIEEVYKPGTEGTIARGTGEALRQRSQLSMWTNYREVLKDSTFIIYSLACMLLVSVEFHLGSYVGVRMEKEMLNVPFLSWKEWSMQVDGLQMLGFLRTENTVLIVLLSMTIRYVIGRFSDKKVLLLGYTLYVAGYTYIAYSSHPWMLLLSMLIATWGELMYVPVNQAYLGDIAPEHARSSYMAISGLVYKGAMLLAGGAVVLGGFLPSWLMAALIGLCGVSGILLFYSILAKLDSRKELAMKPASQSVVASA